LLCPGRARSFRADLDSGVRMALNRGHGPEIEID